MSPERAWSEWLDAVESAARTVEQQALAREVPQQPAGAMSTVAMPGAPWPPSLEARRREVLATLAAATETVERCRDETGAALKRLAHAPARPAPTGYADGTAVDVLG
jgi:hypothetical protein